MSSSQQKSSSFKSEASSQMQGGKNFNAKKDSKFSEKHEERQNWQTSGSGDKESFQKFEKHEIEAGLSAEEMERRARELRKQAQDTLRMNEQEFQQAQTAQRAAQIAAEQANVKTEKALLNQERGQHMLAEAGAQLIEAGARLQQEASAEKRQVPFNVHQQGEVRQTTCVSSAAQEIAAKAHEAVTFREVETVPPVEMHQKQI